MLEIFICVDDERDEETGEMLGITLSIPKSTDPVDLINAIRTLYPTCTFYSVDQSPVTE